MRFTQHMIDAMRSLIRKNWIHVLIWTLMAIYLTVAHDIYIRFILKEGVPVQFDQKLPQPTDQISFALDRLDLIKGQDLYDLWGWSFISGDSDQTAYERWIILMSGTKTYFYPAKSVQRPELQTAFKDIDTDLSNAGISTHISKYTIEPGEYRIGILFRHKTTDAKFYVVTNKRIIRTPNQVRMETLNPQP